MFSGLRSQLATEFATGVTAPPAPRPRWLRRGRADFVFLADFAVALICFGATDRMLGTDTTRSVHHYGSGEVLLLALVLSAPLVLRTRLPVTAWASSAAAILLTDTLIPLRAISSTPYLPGAVIVYGLCLYAVAVRCKAWVVLTAVLVTVVGVTAVDSQTAVVATILTAFPVLAGVVVRSRRSGREQLLVAERRHEDERAVLEERQRIARELHDVVAHHMSVIAIQAEAAPYKTADPPQELVESFADIRTSALSGLGELRRVLGVLRSETPGTAPTPGLADLDGLLESARTGGVRVSCEITGAPRALPGGVDLSAYRIVQEALSNAIRHAPGSRVQVGLYYGEAALVIEVRNPGAAAALERDEDVLGRDVLGRDVLGRDVLGRDVLGRGGGHGIIGMRERAAMLGGHLSAGPTIHDEFLVTAALPLDGGDQELAPRPAVMEEPT